MNERFNANELNFKLWSDFFHRNGYIIIDNAISNNDIKNLCNELYSANKKNENKKNNKKNRCKHIMHKRFFEISPTTISLVESSVLFDFAQYVIKDVPGERGNTLSAHLIHNNAFSVPPGGRGQAPVIHTDDCLQQVIIPEGVELPDCIKLPVLAATWMIWLSDCTSEENGPTYVVPKSHRWGKETNADLAKTKEIPMCGKAGTAVLVNNQTWHRGAANTSSVSRDTLQMTFARRMIGHKYGSIMNYNMPIHVIKDKSPQMLERFGFLEGGAYS